MLNATQAKVWVLVADGEKARVVTPDAVANRFVTVRTIKSGEPSHPAHLREGPHNAGKVPFAGDVAQNLSHEAEQGSFDQLVLIAPGHVLHAVKEALSKKAASLVVGTVSHDYTHFNDHDLSPHIAQWWLARAPEADA